MKFCWIRSHTISSKSPRNECLATLIHVPNIDRLTWDEFLLGWFLPTSNIGSSYWSLKHLGDSHVLNDPNIRKYQARIKCVISWVFVAWVSTTPPGPVFLKWGSHDSKQPNHPNQHDYGLSWVASQTIWWSPEWLNTFASSDISDIWSANGYGTVIWMIGSTQWVDGPFSVEKNLKMTWCWAFLDDVHNSIQVYNLKFQAM